MTLRLLLLHILFIIGISQAPRIGYLSPVLHIRKTWSYHYQIKLVYIYKTGLENDIVGFFIMLFIIGISQHEELDICRQCTVRGSHPYSNLRWKLLQGFWTYE